jgi:hypothetical protein
MKINIFLAALCFTLAFCKNKEKAATEPAPVAATTPVDPNLPVLTEDEKVNGWRLLFDGQSTKGWHRYGGAPIGEGWKVSEGSLMLDASNKEGWQTRNGGDILTNEEFASFHLKLEWKIDTCGNSGIIFFVQEDTAKYDYVWHTGPEMQVLDNKCHPDAKIVKHRAGDLYDLISSSKETVKPALEWNQAEIVYNNDVLDLYLNGEKVVSTKYGDEAWKKMVAGSKFKSMPGFGAFKQGRIALQDHGNTVWYRNIKIKEL